MVPPDLAVLEHVHDLRLLADLRVELAAERELRGAALALLASLTTCHDRLHVRYLAALEHARDLRAQARTT
jgi:hypothetical protein